MKYLLIKSIKMMLLWAFFLLASWSGKQSGLISQSKENTQKLNKMITDKWYGIIGIDTEKS